MLVYSLGDTYRVLAGSVGFVLAGFHVTKRAKVSNPTPYMYY
jgi:hypothetical protein